MPVIIPNDLPAAGILAGENIFTMTEFRASHQDIRPLQIAILNLMPTKSATETQLLRVLGNTPLQTEITLVRLETHECRNTPEEYLERFYTHFSEIKNRYFDGLIITGAPVEHLDFEAVDYWEELKEFFDWSKTHAYSTFHICWGAQAALYHHYGIQKFDLPEKCFGVFEHQLTDLNRPLLRGFDDTFYIPQSRHTEIRQEDIEKHGQLKVVAHSNLSGPGLILSNDNRHIYATGHSEYDPETLGLEYFRDVNRGLDIQVPINYFPGNNPENPPAVKWRSHAHLLFSNWLNYCVYQETPYEVNQLESTAGTDDYPTS